MTFRGVNGMFFFSSGTTQFLSYIGKSVVLENKFQTFYERGRAQKGFRLPYKSERGEFILFKVLKS